MGKGVTMSVIVRFKATSLRSANIALKEIGC